MTTTVTERPILFSGPMVRAIRAGRKTQTRRVINRLRGWGPITEFGPSDTRGYDWRFRDARRLWNEITDDRLRQSSPYGQPGDRLWVKETFYVDDIDWIGQRLPRDGSAIDHAALYYRADGECCEQMPECSCGEVGKPTWRPSIHMPRWASRITLDVVTVRVERLQEISEADVLAEGFDDDGADETEQRTAYSYQMSVPRYRLARTWDRLNAKRGFGWDANPWLWVVEWPKLTEARS